VLSLVIPAYAEAKFLGATLSTLREFLVRKGELATTEVIVVTADAADGTAAIARQALAAFPNHQHLEPGPKVGKGRDVRAGMLAARGDTVLFMDADLATPLAHIDEAVARIAAGADVVIGMRDLASMHNTLGRRLTSQLSNQLVRAVLLPGLADTQCGFKAFRGPLVATLFEPLTTFGWGFDLEILARARRAGAWIEELPVPDWHDPKGDDGLAGETQWLARLRTLRELAVLALSHGRQPARCARPAGLASLGALLTR
jgi:glycosyltransferase involved in cell wall biosynthesis